MRIRAKKKEKVEFISKEEQDQKDVTENNDTYKNQIKTQVAIPDWKLQFHNFAEKIQKNLLFQEWYSLQKDDKE